MKYFFHENFKINRFNVDLLSWYSLNKRDLPWRKTKDPYKIWLSEIILQQTKVSQGAPYYQSFVKNYPRVEDLAKADEQEVLNRWRGLGYYSRAKNLHLTAKIITDKYNGIFPSKYEDILALKGIGKYTASAIASFSFDLPFAVLDGNVFRFLSRLLDIDVPINSSLGQKTFEDLSKRLLNLKNPSIHNQAIMEFGALNCTYKNPKCKECPFEKTCLSRINGSITLRPVKNRKKKVRNRFFVFKVFHLKENGSFIVKKRLKKDIWESLYEFPSKEFFSEKIFLEEIEKKTLEGHEVSDVVNHLLSHQKIIAVFVHYKKRKIQLKPGEELVSFEMIEKYPMPRLIDRYIESFFKKKLRS